ncbi:MAG: type IV toxin-antitoxin system AbiEi family antitoxin domain-containing protein [Maribacter sp.]|nr:type IV toxin-antitoxin system AbiEi family antitoxin domain-containing protein [Maribacter sp.]
MNSEKQTIILNHLKENETISTQEAVNLIGYGIYCNRSNYVAKTLSRMVKNGSIARVKPGLFRLPISDDYTDYDLLTELK